MKTRINRELKRTVLLIMVILLMAFPLFSQFESIPDQEFLYALIEEGVDTDSDGLISYAEAEAVTTLDIQGEGYCGWFYCDQGEIASLVGIEAFTKLRTLSCEFNQIDSLDLSQNTALTFLNCNDNGITYLDVSGCTHLYGLNCAMNDMTSLDVSGCTALTYLDCSGYQLTNLDVSGCTALFDLNINENQLRSLDLSNNTALKLLNCSGMGFLNEVCVWESFHAGVEVFMYDSPKVYFTTECNPDAFPTYRYIRFGSTDDPLNGLTITWESNGNSDSIAWGNTSNLEQGVYHGLKRDGEFGSMFDYTFPPLTAASTIHYTIFDSKDNIWTEEKTFNTASDPSKNKFSFTALGDSHTDMNQWQIVSEAILETDFTLFLGDIIAHGDRTSDWYLWFEYGEEFVAREPVYHTIGEYDTDNSSDGYDYYLNGYNNYVSEYDNYLSMFTLPGNELYYSFTYGNAVFICLNSHAAENSEQYSWLLKTLEANKDHTWKIVFFHMPFYTSPSHEGEMDEYFETWWKAFDDYGVDVIFNGHTHNYQRTSPIDRNISTTSPVDIYGSLEGMGRCQIVSGGAGEGLMDAANPGLWWLCKSESKHHFCNIDIDGDLMKIKAIDVNHVVFDEFIIDKSWTGKSDFSNTISWIYPNPASDFLTLQLIEPGEYSIEIFSMNGQNIQQRNFTGHTHQIDLSSFQKGVYLITVRSKDIVKTQKVIKL